MVYEDKFTTLTETELEEIDGGGPLLIAFGIGFACGTLFSLGVYNGYKDTKDQK